MAGTNATIKALRALSRDQTVQPKDFVRHIRELTGRNDRLIALVCGSNIEVALRGLLETRMPNGAGVLFEPKEPLSTFSAKIALAFSLGLIAPDVRRNADYIREIRNVFAHRIGPTTFRTPEVSAACALLSLGRWQTTIHTDNRTHFLRAAIETGAAITKKKLLPYDAPPASLPDRRPQLLPLRDRERRHS